jgi:DNA-binding Lrp family transcriptional regulator
MIISLIKEQTGKEILKEFEAKYGSIENLEDKWNRTNNVLFYNDLETWKYYLKHPNRPYKQTHSIVTNRLNLSDLDMNLLEIINEKKPKSIRELARLINKDVATVQPKITNLSEKGFVEFKKGTKNSKIPYLTFDKIEIGLRSVV